MSIRKLGDAAARIYGQQSSGSNEIQSLIPRFSFQFNVTIYYLGRDGKEEYLTTLPRDDKPATLRVATAQLPTHSAKISTLNQYNKRRVVQTGVEYNPVSISFYDTRDSNLDYFLLAYHDHYYNGVMDSAAIKYLNDIHLVVQGIDSPEGGFAQDNSRYMYADGSSQTGYAAPGDRNFIKRIEIERISSNEDRIKHTIFNPFIQSINVSELDYASNNSMLYNISFMYEGYSIIDRVQPQGTINPTPLDKQYMDRDEPDAWWTKITESGNPTPMHFQADRNVDGTGSPTPFLDMSPKQTHVDNQLSLQEQEAELLKFDSYLRDQGLSAGLPTLTGSHYDPIRGEPYIFVPSSQNIPGASNVGGEGADRLYYSDLNEAYRLQDYDYSDYPVQSTPQEVPDLPDLPSGPVTFPVANDVFQPFVPDASVINPAADDEKARLAKTVSATYQAYSETNILIENKQAQIDAIIGSGGTPTQADYEELATLKGSAAYLKNVGDTSQAKLNNLTYNPDQAPPPPGTGSSAYDGWYYKDLNTSIQNRQTAIDSEGDKPFPDATKLTQLQSEVEAMKSRQDILEQAPVLPPQTDAPVAELKAELKETKARYDYMIEKYPESTRTDEQRAIIEQLKANKDLLDMAISVQDL